MITQVAAWLTDMTVKYWNFLLNGGIIGVSIIVLLVLRKIAALVRHFTS